MASRRITVTVKGACGKGGSAVDVGRRWIGNRWTRSGLCRDGGTSQQQRFCSRANAQSSQVKVPSRHCVSGAASSDYYRSSAAVSGLGHRTYSLVSHPKSSVSSLAVEATSPKLPPGSRLGPVGSLKASTAERSADQGQWESSAKAIELEVMHRRSRALWEPDMPREEASEVLRQFLGMTDLRPGDVVVLDSDDILKCLEMAAQDKRFEAALFSHASGVTERFFQKDVYYRGIVEFSNVCENDCYYCGIRKHKEGGVHRYTIPKEDVVSVAMWAFDHKYGTLMLQGGQLNSPPRMEYLVDLIGEIRRKTIAKDLEQRRAKGVITDGLDATKLGLCISLSVGELSEESYRRLYDAGASRYLIRIETSNPELFSDLHPGNQRFEKRLECLRAAKRAGFQIGTGVMIGLPGQTPRDLANDIAFFRQEEADMIGMGPYITEEGTPTTEAWKKVFGGVANKKKHMLDMCELTTRMIALARITLGNVNIAATTALQAIDPVGREIALRRGANILMPILTPTKYRIDYQLYEGKPCITDTAEECRNCLNARVGMVGKQVKLGTWADPPHFLQPIVTKLTPPGTRAIHTSARSTTCGQQKDYHVNTLRNTFLWGRRPLLGLLDSVRGASSAVVSDLGSASRDGKEGGKSTRTSDLPRINIGMFGSMNAGKSTLVNLVTMQGTSIVDATPGTTADTKIAFMELHGVGPVKLFDTAGIDERGKLGEKKREKSLNVLKECDLVLLVVDPLRGCEWNEAGRVTMVTPEEMVWEKRLLDLARKRKKEVVILFNSKFNVSMSMGINEKFLNARIDSIRNELDPNGHFGWTSVDLSDCQARQNVTDVLEKKITELQGGKVLPALPPKYLSRDAMVFLNIPMDAETPGGRLLRPQAMVQEEILRSFGSTIAYRMDLAAARGTDEQAREAERTRFLDALRSLQQHEGQKLLVTDSQAMDIVHPWTMDPSTGKPMVDITTFSIALIQRQTDGRLGLLVKGLEAYKSLRPGDRVLVAEACNHNRITELCNDIATVQIPQQISKENPQGGVIIDHAFGREFPDLDGANGLRQYKLAIHCGGCMVDRQKIIARIADLEEACVPVTNFGLVLSYAAAPEALARVLEPYDVEIPKSVFPQ